MPKFKTTLLPGSYYIGDPCYVMGKNWDRFLRESSFLAFRESSGEYNINGHNFVISHTAHGDGTYTDGITEYPVDSGCLAVVPLALVQVPNEKCIRVGFITHFKEPFEVELEAGKFYVGDKIMIDTEDEDWEPEDE